MDVDLLRPGTVPISPDTVLWFEFLLDERLLLVHLQKPSPDPSPIELINKFSSVVFECYNNEVKRIDLDNADMQELSVDEHQKYSLKHLALKILSLKIASYIKWDLDILRSIPFRFQLLLLQDLMFFTNDKTFIEIPNIPTYEDISSLSAPFLFSLVLYHRWVIRVAVGFGFSNYPKICGNADFTAVDESTIRTSDTVQKSLHFLAKCLTLEQIPELLTFNCFTMLTETNTDVQNNWTNSVPISKEEFYAQVAYDLAVFHFFKENYDAASVHFSICKDNFKNISSKSGFLCIDRNELEGYLSACNKNLENACSLLQDLQTSIVNHYLGTIGILQQDNIHKQIPIFIRMNLELDIRSALSSGKFVGARDFLPKIEALNAVRCFADKVATSNYEINITNVDTFIWAILPVLSTFTEDQLKHSQLLLVQQLMVAKEEDAIEIIHKLMINKILPKKVGDDVLTVIKKASTMPVILQGAQKDIFEFPNRLSNQRLEVQTLENQIIICYDPQELRHLLIKLSSRNSNKSVWRINPCWELPIPLQSVLVAMPKGFLQDFSIILLAKSREMMLSKNWSLSLDLLKVLESEVYTTLGIGTVTAKLNRLISWEALLIKISQLLEEWPASDIDKHKLALECEACLQIGESILPRTEIMEHCALCLLSLGHWDFLVSLEKRWSYFEIAATLALACQDLHKYKGFKKLSRDVWDLVLPVFGSFPLQSKRSSSGSTSLIQRDSPTASTKLQLSSFFSRLRDDTVLDIVISMLARLHNVLRDESSLELSSDFISLWPAVVSNANSYNLKAVLEVLTAVLVKALTYHPTNIQWIKLLGDVNFVNGHYEESLNWYLKALLLISDNFILPLENENHILKRMIKSCINLNCYTQAAVLCQFLEEPDYALAFHSLAEQKLCSDATDAYYHCFWDTSILEYLVNLHHKRAEYQRRKHGIQVMGLLELNSNNNHEIQREAANIRKGIFLKALCKQYVH